MPELVLTRQAAHLHVQLGAQQTLIDWNAFTALAAGANDAKQLAADPVGYGRALYDLVFADPNLRDAVTRLPTDARLLLVSSDAQVSQAGWELLRDENSNLLAARIS